MTFHCLLLVVTLCQALHDRPVVALGAAQTAVVAYDITQTRLKLIANVSHESNPLAGPFVHSNAVAAAAGAGELLLSGFLAEKMRHSRHGFIRKTWWLPQAIPLLAHTVAAATSR